MDITPSCDLGHFHPVRLQQHKRLLTTSRRSSQSSSDLCIGRTTLPVAHLSFHLSSLSSSHRLGTIAAVVAAAAAAAEAAAAAASSSVLLDEVCLKQAIATSRDALSSLWDDTRARGTRNTLCSELRARANMAFLLYAEGAATTSDAFCVVFRTTTPMRCNLLTRTGSETTLSLCTLRSTLILCSSTRSEGFMASWDLAERVIDASSSGCRENLQHALEHPSAAISPVCRHEVGRVLRDVAKPHAVSLSLTTDGTL